MTRSPSTAGAAAPGRLPTWTTVPPRAVAANTDPSAAGAPEASKTVALRAPDAGGTLAVAGIHLTEVPRLDYAGELFRERQLRSDTANTRADGEEFLRLAAALRIRPTTTPHPLAEADRVLADLAAGRVTGAAELLTGQ